MMKIDIAQLEFINHKLREIALAIEEKYGEQTVTSLYRIDDNGVHGTLPLRGMDLRCHDTTTGSVIESFVNGNWEYDPSRPEKHCCMFHSVGQGWHLHLQVHPKTVKRFE